MMQVLRKQLCLLIVRTIQFGLVVLVVVGLYTGLYTRLAPLARLTDLQTIGYILADRIDVRSAISEKPALPEKLAPPERVELLVVQVNSLAPRSQLHKQVQTIQATGTSTITQVIASNEQPDVNTPIGQLLFPSATPAPPVTQLLPTLSPTVTIEVSLALSQTLTPANVFATATAAQAATITARPLIKETPTPTPTPTPFSIYLPAEDQPNITATAEKIAGEATVNAVLTSVDLPGFQLETLTPTRTPIVVTATTTPGDIFAAATQAAQVTLAATVNGTATPVPDNWLVVTPVLVYNTPTPANVATAQVMAALATAQAATTGTPDPYRVTLVMTVVTATSTPTSIVAAAQAMVAATQQALVNGTATPLPRNWLIVTPIVVTNTPTPANAATAAMQFNVGQAIARLTGTPPPYAVIAVATPTPVLIPVDDPSLLGNDPILGPPKLTFPTELVGKILFVGEFNRYQGDLRKVIYAINPDGSGLARLTDGWAYDIAEERDSYNAEGSARAFAQRDPNDQRIQIHVEDFVFASFKPLTAFGAGVAWQPAWSPISNQIALVSSESRNDEIWVVERGVWPALQYTHNDWAWDHHPSWSPDGSTIVFSSNRTGQEQIWFMDADGNNQRQLTNFAFEAYNPVWVKYANPYLPIAGPADDGDPKTRERICLVCLYVVGQ